LFYNQNFICLVLAVVLTFSGFRAQTHSKETVVLETSYGTIKLKLFEETPLHKANFLKLAKQKYFDSLLFHRVINEFMIQGGDPLSRRAAKGDSLGHGDAGYLVPAEFNRKIIHRKGRLCAARDNEDINPDQASSASQFYIVMGKARTPEELVKTEEKMNKRRLYAVTGKYNSTPEGKRMNGIYKTLLDENKQDSAAIIKTQIDNAVNAAHTSKPAYKFNEEEIKIYSTIGGTPHLDGSYTVFGELTEGQDIVDRIAAAKTDARDRPVEDIRMKIYILNQ
jgi:peptidylprolyl isomerase